AIPPVTPKPIRNLFIQIGTLSESPDSDLTRQISWDKIPVSTPSHATLSLSSSIINTQARSITPRSLSRAVPGLSQWPLGHVTYCINVAYEPSNQYFAPFLKNAPHMWHRRFSNHLALSRSL